MNEILINDTGLYQNNYSVEEVCE